MPLSDTVTPLLLPLLSVTPPLPPLLSVMALTPPSPDGLLSKLPPPPIFP